MNLIKYKSTIILIIGIIHWWTIEIIKAKNKKEVVVICWRIL